MSCTKLKSYVAANSASYPADFVRMINSVSEDATAQQLLDQNEKHGILAPDHNFVLQVVLATRRFLQLGLIKTEESWLTASKTLLLFLSLASTVHHFMATAPKEQLNPQELFNWFLCDQNFRDDMKWVAIFF